jgi:hypothetical protein
LASFRRKLLRKIDAFFALSYGALLDGELLLVATTGALALGKERLLDN